MSGAAEDLRHKLAGAKDLQGVVRSMKALAASSIGQYEKAVASLEDYYRTVELGLGACFRAAGPGRPGQRPARRKEDGRSGHLRLGSGPRRAVQ